VQPLRTERTLETDVLRERVDGRPDALQRNAGPTEGGENVRPCESDERDRCLRTASREDGDERLARRRASPGVIVDLGTSR